MESGHTRGPPGGRRGLVVIGASAGGVEVLSQVVRDLPPDLAAAVCIVLHVAPGSPSMLAQILGRAGRLPCRPARDGDDLQHGLVLVAPPDHHLVIEDSRVRLTVGPRENGHRPAIDVLFRSAASAFDSRVVGVVVSGTRDDGSAGLAVIKASGGRAIVQVPNDATYAGMPAGAIANVNVDAIVPAALIGSTIASMVGGEGPPPSMGPDEPGSARGLDPACDPEANLPPAPPRDDQVVAVCPESGGVLIDARAENPAQALSARRFRRQSQAAPEHAEIVRHALAGAAGTTLWRVIDTDDEESAGEAEEGAA